MADKLLIMGDSHLLLVVRALRGLRPDLLVLGGQFQVDRDLDSFSSFDEMGRLQLNALVRPQLAEFLEPAGLSGEDMREIDFPIVISLSGVQRVAMMPDWSTHLPFEAPDRHFLSSQTFEAILRGHYKETLLLFRNLAEAGRQAAAIVAPGMRSNHERRGEVYLAVKDFFTAEVAGMGLPVIDVTGETCDSSGVLQPYYWSANPQDHVHANENWAERIARGCLREFDL